MDITSHQGVLHAFLVSMLPGQAAIDERYVFEAALEEDVVRTLYV